MDTTTAQPPFPLSSPPRDLPSILAAENSLLFPAFTADTAWSLGSLLRHRLLTFPTPTVISVSLAGSKQPLFYSAVRPGTTPDNVSWVHRKQNTVLRFGVSTWYMHNKFSGDEGAFARKYGLGERAGEYAIHGGGVPIRVRGVEGVVAVVVVSGLKQEEDHMIVVQTVGDFLESLGEAVGVEGEKKKED